ncbi:MAG: hypothetical protein Q4E91_09065 [Lachnospiraceae bacterium]|nr:hypothetical protein [Lachnospiraceae bacterium]
MRRKVVTVLLGSVLTAAVWAGSAQALTYSYDLGESRILTILGPEKDQTQAYLAQGSAEYEVSDRVWQEDVEYEASASLSAEEQKRLDDWHKQEMKEQVAYLEKYGISYDADRDRLLYQGKTVRWLIDEQINDTYVAIQMPEGEIDVYTVREADYALSGVRIATQEEYDARTRKEERTYTYVRDRAEETASARDWYEEESMEKRREYEAYGIGYDAAEGFWTWQGKAIYLLMDEDGSMCQNGSEEAKKNKIYILVRRDADGSVSEVKQITVEEVLAERIAAENN